MFSPEIVSTQAVIRGNRKPDRNSRKWGASRKRHFINYLSKGGGSSRINPPKRSNLKFPEIPVKLKKDKVWVPDPEFIKKFEGMYLYPNDKVLQCKHYPYNGKKLAGEMKKVPKVINFGPCHPAAHGVLRLLLQLDGEKIEAADPHIGLLHRGTEKLMENKTYLQCLPYFDRFLIKFSFPPYFITFFSGLITLLVWLMSNATV